MSNYIFICEICLFDVLFFPQLQIWYVEVRISRIISESLGLRDNEGRLYVQTVLPFKWHITIPFLVLKRSEGLLQGKYQVLTNIGIKHGFFMHLYSPGLGFQQPSRDLANVNALKKTTHVRSLLLHKNWKYLLHFALFLALFCFAFSPMFRKSNFHGLCSF